MKNIQLETERLLLRQWRLEDFETYEKMCADEPCLDFYISITNELLARD